MSSRILHRNIKTVKIIKGVYLSIPYFGTLFFIFTKLVLCDNILSCFARTKWFLLLNNNNYPTLYSIYLGSFTGTKIMPNENKLKFSLRSIE